MAKKPRQASIVVVATWSVTLLALPVAAQQGFREQVSINDSGQVLQFPEQGGVEGEPSAQRVTGSAPTILIETTDTVASTTVEGLGARAQLNNSGVSAIKVSFQDDRTNTPCTTATCNDGAIVRVDGTSTTVLALARNNGTGTAVGSHTVCAVSPMPRINNNSQAAFHAFLDINGSSDGSPIDCSSGITQQDTTQYGLERSAILRHSGGTLGSLIQGRINGGASTISVGAPFSPIDTYQVTEVTLNAEGGERFNNSGVALIDAWLETQAGIDTDDADALACNGGGLDHRCAERDDRHALLLVDGTTTTLVAMAGPDGTSPYQVLSGGMLSPTGQVVFKADRGTGSSCGLKGGGCTQTGHELVLFSGGVRTTIVETGDDVPSSSDPNVIFCDFSPYVGFDGGDIAFQAKVATDGTCNLSGSAEQGDGIFLYSGGTITEVARDTDLATNDAGSAGPFTSSFEGVDFDRLGGGLALSGGTVFFLAEDETFDDPVACTTDEFGSATGGELSAIIAFTPGTGLETLLREGDLLPNGDRILRMYSDPNVLNEQTNDAGQLVMVMDLDTDGDCAATDGEDEPADSTIALVTGTIISAPLAVPSATAVGLTLMVLLLSTTAVWWLRNPTVA